MTVIKPRRFASNFFSMDNTMSVQETKAFTVSQHRSVDSTAPRVSHVDIDYVPLDSKSTGDEQQKENELSTVVLSSQSILHTPSMFFDDD
jgi:hypothetical protein